MARLAVKLLLLDEADRVLLIHARDPKTQAECWYPVGGGVDPGESLQSAAAREAYEETGLRDLPPGTHMWTRDHTYEFNGQSIDVHEEWLLHQVAHFTPAPAQLSEYESTTFLGFAWWTAQDLDATTETVYPPELGRLVAVVAAGTPTAPGVRATTYRDSRS